MNEARFTLPQWLPPALREDPKKTGVLSALLLVFVLMLAHWMFGGPAKATAAAAKPPAVSARSTVKANNSAPIQGADSVVRAWVKRPVFAMPRNLFVIRKELYPRAEAPAVATPVTTPTFWDSIGKSQARQADENKQKAILIQNLQREAARLELQSTMMGPVPQAIVSGTMVHQGSLISADATGLRFRIVKIEARAVVVEREGITLRLTMTP